MSRKRFRTREAKRGDPSPSEEPFFCFFPEIRRRLADCAIIENTCAARAKLKLRENLGTRRLAKFDADALFTRPSPPHEARGAHNAARRLFSAALARDSSARGDARRTLPGRDPRERLSIPRNIQSRGRLHLA
jgi:hypothetical protein